MKRQTYNFTLKLRSSSKVAMGVWPIPFMNPLSFLTYPMLVLKPGTSALFLLVSISVHAQSLRKITGIVHAETPLEAADCFLKNYEHVGTLTDTSGYFAISFPESMSYDTLVIWAMGFERMEVPLASIDLRCDTVHFYLQQQSIVLKEILIESTGLDLRKTVLQAVANVPDNYPIQPHQLTGLYRKISTKGAQFTHLEEAAIVVEDVAYRKPTALVKIKAEYYRQSKDWGELDSLYISRSDKMGKAISQQLKLAMNPLNKLYESNFIRHYNKENAWFNFKAFRKIVNDNFHFELVDVTVAAGDTLYRIAFAANTVPPPPDHVSGRNYLIINASDLAIVEMQFTLGFDHGPMMSQNHVRFEKKKGKYYPKYIRNIAHRHINKNIDDDEYDIRIFWFDDVRLEGFKRIKPSEANDPNDSRSHQRVTYSPVFWDTTSLIYNHPLDESVEADLRRHEPLESQFMATQQE